MGTKKISRETSKTVQVKEDPVTKELYFDLPPGVLKSLGWKEDDELEWYGTQEGNWKWRIQDLTDLKEPLNVLKELNKVNERISD